MTSKVHSIKSDQVKIVTGIQKNDPQTIKQIYLDNFGKVKAMVNNFNYINLEPDDVFQEGLTRAVINIRKGIFKGDSTFSTYLYGICRNICLKEYNKSKPLTTNEMGDVKEIIEDDNFDAIHQLLTLKERMDDVCKDIIDLRFGITDKESKPQRFEAIAKKLGITPDNARQRFGRCMTKLKKMVKEDVLLNQLMD